MSELVEFQVPIKKYHQPIFVLGGGSVTLLVLSLSSLVFAVLEKDGQLLQEALEYFAVFPFMFLYAMWFIFGYEKAIINDVNIELLKSNRILTWRKTYPISEVISVTIIEKKLKSDHWIDFEIGWLREEGRTFPFWRKMGKLKLETTNGEVTFFNGLSSSESQIMKERIENEIEKRKHNTT